MIVLYFIITQSKKPLKFTASQLVNGILLSKLLWPTVRKKCSSVREKLLKLEAEGTNIYITIEQFIQIVKGQNNVW